jgi:antitoxin component of RelBE/YafQ-DinJ toxin-antitoxin module
MSTVTVKINTTTNRGKHILVLLREMAKTGKDIHLEHTPNKTTIKAMNEAESGKTKKAKSVDELFDSI